MKNIFCQIFLLAFILGMTAGNVCAEPYGPDIKGLQLGMNVEKFKQFMERHGFLVINYVKSQNSYMSTELYIGSDNIVRKVLAYNDRDREVGELQYLEKPAPKDILQGLKNAEFLRTETLYTDKGIEVVSVSFMDDQLYSFAILNQGIELLFNAPGSRKGFLQAFINNYRIPNMEEKQYKKDVGQQTFTVTEYEYKNVKEGYKIICQSTSDKEVDRITVSAIPKESGNFSF